MSMLSPQSLRKQLAALSALSEKKPCFYFMHGYFSGLAAMPTLVPPSNWLHHLMGDIAFESESQLTLQEALFQLYNQIMDEAMDCCVSIPNQCKLSKSDIQGSLAPGQPLPQWCSGVISSFEFLDTDALEPGEYDIIEDCEKRVLGFTSWHNLRSYCRWAGNEWQQQAVLERRLLAGCLEELIDVLRFGGGEADEGDFPFDDPDSDDMLLAFDDKVSEDIDEIMATEDPAVIVLIDAIIEGFDAAIAELQTLLRLNPGDNQAARFALINMLICKQRWEELETLLTQFNEPSLPVLGGKALLAYHNDPKGEEASRAKRALLDANKYVLKYLTGQKKVKHFRGMYSPGSADEAELYIMEHGKEAWRSVAGALFWLRAK